MLGHAGSRRQDGRVEEFAAILPRVGQASWENLEYGAVLLSCMGRRMSHVDMSDVRKTLDRYAEELAPRFRGKSAMTCARLLSGYLSNQLGYSGSGAPARLRVGTIIIYTKYDDSYRR